MVFEWPIDECQIKGMMLDGLAYAYDAAISAVKGTL